MVIYNLKCYEQPLGKRDVVRVDPIITLENNT